MKTKLKTFSAFLPKSEAAIIDFNHHRVPKKQWDKWSWIARTTFNALYSEMIQFQCCFVHPKAAVIPCEHWKTIAWNAAWIAATATHNAAREQNYAKLRRDTMTAIRSGVTK